MLRLQHIVPKSTRDLFTVKYEHKSSVGRLPKVTVVNGRKLTKSKYQVYRQTSCKEKKRINERVKKIDKSREKEVKKKRKKRRNTREERRLVNELG